jgi:hypothetical protein
MKDDSIHMTWHMKSLSEKQGLINPVYFIAHILPDVEDRKPRESQWVLSENVYVRQLSARKWKVMGQVIDVDEQNTVWFVRNVIWMVESSDDLHTLRENEFEVATMLAEFKRRAGEDLPVRSGFGPFTVWVDSLEAQKWRTAYASRRCAVSCG